MDRNSYGDHKKRGEHRAFLWLSLERHVQPLRAELKEHFDATGIHIPMQVKLLQIVDDYCRSKERRGQPAKAVKRRGPVAA